MTAEPASTAPYVFLSYASAEQDRALVVVEALQAAGIPSWLDRHAIAGGTAWSAEIVDGITGCAAFIVLGSERAFRSPNVQRELNLAVEENRPLLPLLLERTEQPREVRYALAGRQWVPLQDRTTEVWLPDVLRALAGLGIVAATSAAPAAPQPARLPTNLPVSLTSFLGREQELADLAQLLANTRLVTLTGPGGTGKTRLALGAAAAQAEQFPDGVFFVDLAPLQDPTLVPSAVAQALGVQGIPETPLRDSVLRFLRDKRLLLVLDNYEHLLAAAEFAGAILQAGSDVTLLVTSRAPLRVSGEREYPVPPLLVPQAGSGSAALLAQNPAAALFTARAQAVRPDFALTDANAATVATICMRLDGLPLAIELAAARVRALPPAALLARLEQRLPLLTGGRRDMPARQQTLRAAIDWSYALLEPAEQRLFRRLGVFAGGCTLELAEAVCNADGDLVLDVLDGMSSLVEKSLLRAGDGQAPEPRYRMLETIREFALEQLEASGEAETLRRQLAVLVLQLARQAAAAQDWARLDPDVDNARAVLGWCVDQAELGVGVRLLWALQGYLNDRGGRKEYEQWRQRLLSLPEASQPSSSRARLLAGFLSEFPTDLDEIAADLDEAIRLSRELGDQSSLGVALRNLGMLRLGQGRFDDADALAEEAVPLLLAAGNTYLAKLARGDRIAVALAHGDISTAEALLAASQTPFATTDPAFLRMQEAWLAEAHGDLAEARRLLQGYVHRVEVEQGEQSPFRLTGLTRLAWVALHQGDSQAALTTCAQSLVVQGRLGPSDHLPAVLSVLALVAERTGLLSLSSRLSAAISAVQPFLNSLEMLHVHAEQQASVQRVRAALGETAFAAAWAEGEAL
ncbi:MAG: ATP-binding protein, partial [Dehalococcoidia bacterium]